MVHHYKTKIMKKNLTKIYNIFKQIENLSGTTGWDQTAIFYYFYENNDLVKCWELLYGLFSENRNISLLKFGVDLNLSTLRKLANGISSIYEFGNNEEPILVATLERNGKHQISGTVKIENTDISEEKTIDYIDGINVSEDNEDSDKTKIINSLKSVHDFNEIYVVDNNTIYCNTYDEIVESFITYLLNDLGFTAKTRVTKVPSVQTDFYWDINISEINKIDESFDLKLTDKLKTKLLANKNITLSNNIVYFTDDQNTIDDVFSVFDSENQYFDVEWEWNYDGLGNNRGIINEKHIDSDTKKDPELIAWEKSYLFQPEGIMEEAYAYKQCLKLGGDVEWLKQLKAILKRKNVDYKFFEKYLINTDKLTSEEIKDLGYVEDRLDVHLEDVLTMEDYVKHIASDYQFDINSNDYMGFLNTDPSNSDEWTELAIELANNPEKYKNLLIQYNLEIESADEEEMIFNLITEPTNTTNENIEQQEVFSGIGKSIPDSWFVNFSNLTDIKEQIKMLFDKFGTQIPGEDFFLYPKATTIIGKIGMETTYLDIESDDDFYLITPAGLDLINENIDFLSVDDSDAQTLISNNVDISYHNDNDVLIDITNQNELDDYFTKYNDSRLFVWKEELNKHNLTSNYIKELRNKNRNIENSGLSTFEIEGVTPETLSNTEEVSKFLDYLYDDCGLLGGFHPDDEISGYVDKNGKEIFTQEQQLLYSKYLDDMFELDSDGNSEFVKLGFADVYDYCINYRNDNQNNVTKFKLNYGKQYIRRDEIISGELGPVENYPSEGENAIFYDGENNLLYTINGTLLGNDSNAGEDLIEEVYYFTAYQEDNRICIGIKALDKVNEDFDDVQDGTFVNYIYCEPGEELNIDKYNGLTTVWPTPDKCVISTLAWGEDVAFKFENIETETNNSDSTNLEMDLTNQKKWLKSFVSIWESYNNNIETAGSELTENFYNIKMQKASKNLFDFCMVNGLPFMSADDLLLELENKNNSIGPLSINFAIYQTILRRDVDNNNKYYLEFYKNTFDEKSRNLGDVEINYVNDDIPSIDSIEWSIPEMENQIDPDGELYDNEDLFEMISNIEFNNFQ